MGSYSGIGAYGNPTPIINTSKEQNDTPFENSENIFIIYEPDEEKIDTTANTDLFQISLPHAEHDMSSTPNRSSMIRCDKTFAEKPYRSLECQNKKVHEDIQSCQASIDIPKIPSESIEKLVATPQNDRGKKRKFKPLLKEKDIGRQPLVNKKIELLEKKVLY